MKRAQGWSGAAPKVLVVDDEEDIVAYLVAVLEDNGFQATGERDAAAAYEAIRRDPPDLILLDLMMPEQGGLWLYRQLRQTQTTAAIPVFILTGFSGEEEFVKLLDAPEAGRPPLPEGYLEKPISVPRLLQSLQGLFGEPKAGGRCG